MKQQNPGNVTPTGGTSSQQGACPQFPLFPHTCDALRHVAHMATILSLLFDEQDETAVSAMYQVHDVVLQLKQKPHDGRVYDKDNEALQEHVSTVCKSAADLSGSLAAAAAGAAAAVGKMRQWNSRPLTSRTACIGAI